MDTAFTKQIEEGDNGQPEIDAALNEALAGGCNIIGLMAFPWIYRQTAKFL